MDKDAIKLLVVIISIFFLSMIFCGCTSTEVNDEESNVDFKSDVVNLLDYNIEYTRNREQRIVVVTVTGMIENKLDNMIDVDVTSEFYDENDNYLGEETFTIFGLRGKGNPGYTTTFTIDYDGENSNRISYAKLRAEETK